MSDTFDNPRHRDTKDEATTYDESTRGVTAYDADGTTDRDDSADTVLREERLTAGTETVEAGSVRVRKHVETHPVEYSVPRDIEHVDTSERIAVTDDGDSGEVEVLDDGSVSIPVFEEVLVVTKRLVVRERVIVRKHTVVDEHTLQTELRREHISVDADESIDLVDNRTDVSATHPDDTDATTPTDDQKGTSS